MGYYPYNKYKSKKTPCLYGHLHDSKKEAERCNELHFLLKAKKIKNLEIQKEYELIPAQKFDPPMKNERKACYKADFVYFDVDLGKTIIEDTKGCKTKDYILKRKLMKELYCRDNDTIFIET